MPLILLDNELIEKLENLRPGVTPGNVFLRFGTADKWMDMDKTEQKELIDAVKHLITSIKVGVYEPNKLEQFAIEVLSNYVE